MLISYLVAGTLIILAMRALGEMAAVNPDMSAFLIYTAKALGPGRRSHGGLAVMDSSRGGRRSRV